MLVFPEIQISEGKVVTRVSPEAENIVHPLTPLEAVAKFEAQGAERLHLLDVDAALGEDATNEALIGELIASTPIPVQVAGGMRTLHHIEAWFEAGAAHVVLGTLAITDQQLLAEACARCPGAILANIATKDGYVMIDGWRTQTAFRPQDI
ncbi:MAG: HisA/HisF-related TIM barrel protein, partial [Alphaproteobacteria bacterium]|nr:HisA/HisF-related TIM barrel protein [Alphaproteobacteria bacterium]